MPLPRFISDTRDPEELHVSAAPTMDKDLKVVLETQQYDPTEFLEQRSAAAIRRLRFASPD